MNKRLISIVSPCFNEEANIEPFYKEVKDIFQTLSGKYDYEHIFIDNSSSDSTVSILKKIANKDKNIKIIVNSRDFGPTKSPYYGYLQAGGEAVIAVTSDLEEPPSLIKDFLLHWEQGYKVVVGVKAKSHDSRIMKFFRSLFYSLISRISETDQISNFTGFALCDRTVIDLLASFEEPDPYWRGLISELGFERKEVEYVKPKRKHGVTKNNFYSLYDTAMLGFINHSKVPLRVATFLGFIISGLSILVAIFYLLAKLFFWDTFQAGMAPLIIGLFFFASVQLFFIGILGEYIGAVYTRVKKRPLIIEKERINF